LSPSISAQAREHRLLLAAATLPFLGLLVYLLLPALHLGFISDDFVHLVEDATKPWYTSSDHLNRPLRNGLFRILPLMFGLDPLPYRLLAFFFYGLTAWLLFRFVRQLGFGQGPALTATVLFVFFPRNYEDLFWFAAFQDLIVLACILFACSAWLAYLRTRDLRFFLATHIAYAAALGFKETAIGLPAVLFCLELFRGGTQSSPRLLKRLRPYMLFLAMVVVFGAYVVLLGTGTSASQSTRGSYVPTSPLGVGLPLLRTLVNIILQFSPAATLRDLRIPQIAMAVAGVVFLGLAAKVCAKRKVALFSLCWFVVFTLPTAVFARAVNADRYLALPYLAVLFLVAAALDRYYPLARWQQVVLWLGLLAYALAGSQRLAQFREAFQASADEVDTVGQEMVRLLQPGSLQPGTEVVLVNLIHTRRFYVFNNGVKGVLIEKGLPRQVEVVYDFAESDPAQQRLVNLLQSCRVEPGAAKSVRVLLFSAGHPSDVSGACANQAFETDLRNRPMAWFENPPF
jgi:hypothetical protein